MSRARRHLPSLGFALLVLAWASLLAFLAWGMSTPELERIWQIEQRMQGPDFAGLTTTEVQVLEDGIRRHPELIDELIGRGDLADFVEPTERGWLALEHAHLLARAAGDKPVRVWIECRAQPAAYPVLVRFEAGPVVRELKFEHNGRLSFDLSPAELSKPLLLHLNARAAQSASPSTPAFELAVSAEAATQKGQAP